MRGLLLSSGDTGETDSLAKVRNNLGLKVVPGVFGRHFSAKRMHGSPCRRLIALLLASIDSSGVLLSGKAILNLKSRARVGTMFIQYMLHSI